MRLEEAKQCNKANFIRDEHDDELYVDVACKSLNTMEEALEKYSDWHSHAP
jgi:hypothetical protein